MGWASYRVSNYDGKIKNIGNGRQWKYNAAKDVWRLVSSSDGALVSNAVSGNFSATGGIKLGNDTRTASAAGEGAMRWVPSTDKLQNSDGTAWKDVGNSPGTAGDPVTDTTTLTTQPSGVYHITGSQGNFTGYIENGIHGGGWLGVWNITAHGTTSNKRSWNETAFWTGSSTEGADGSMLSGFYKGQAFSKYENFTEIMIVAHDNGGGSPNVYGGSGGGFGDVYVIKPIHGGGAGHTLKWMMEQGNNFRVTNGTTSRAGTVGGDSYNRYSGEIFIDMNYEMYFNSTYAGGSDGDNFVRVGTNQMNCSDVNCNGHNVGGGYGGKHDRNGAYGLLYTAQPQIGYHNSGTYLTYGNAWTNYTGSSTVWSNNSSQPAHVMMVDFAIYVR